MGDASSPSTRRATSSPARSPARSRAACWSTSASTSSCPPARSTSAGPPTSATTSTKTIECMILKIDEGRRNIVVSRRKLIEDQREQMKKKLLAEIEPGQVRKGVVKNIADFGAFVDLGGIDGLLHITDMSWGRINNPQRHGQDRPAARGLRPPRRQGQGEDRPGPEAEDAQPVGERRGQVPGRQPAHGRGRQRHELRRLRQARSRASRAWSTSPRCPGPSGINHPSELVSIGDKIEVVRSSSINKEKQEISLGMKQVQPNPWDQVAEQVPAGHHHRGRRSAT